MRRELQVENVRSAPELAVAQTHMKKRDAGKEEKRKMAGWSTKVLEESAKRQESEHTKELEQWRNNSQEGVDGLEKELRGTMKEEVWVKSTVDVAEKDAYNRLSGRSQGTGECEPLDWRNVKDKRYQPRKWSEGCRARIFSRFREKSSMNRKYAGRKNGRRGSQSATEDGSHGKDDATNGGSGEHGCAKQMAGS